MMTYLLQALSAFGAGVGTSLSPCVYPMIPITVGYLGANGAERGKAKLRIISFFIGQVLTFTLLGVIAVLLGDILGFSSEIPLVQIGTGALLLIFAFFSAVNRLPTFLEKLKIGTKLNGANSVFGAFLVGASSAAIASPCTSPVVGGLLAAISQVEERIWGITLMVIFAAGLSFLFLVLGLGLAKVSQLPRAGAWMERVRKFSVLILCAGGFYYLFKGFGITTI